MIASHFQFITSEDLPEYLERTAVIAMLLRQEFMLHMTAAIEKDKGVCAEPNVGKVNTL